jgi:hypothetical protein
VAADRLHQLLLLMGEDADAAVGVRPGAGGPAAAATVAGAANAATAVAAPADPTTLALAAALLATPAPDNGAAEGAPAGRTGRPDASAPDEEDGRPDEDGRPEDEAGRADDERSADDQAAEHHDGGTADPTPS